MELEIINNNIINNYEMDKQKTIDMMAKSGFVSIDGKVHQYYPTGAFIKASEGYVTGMYHRIITGLGNFWTLLTPDEVMNLLQNELPKISVKAADEFQEYVDQQLEIHKDSYDEVMKIISTYGGKK